MDLSELFKNIANAIRNKKGTTEPINATSFPDEISNFQTEKLIKALSDTLISYGGGVKIFTGVRANSNIKFKVRFRPIQQCNGGTIVGFKETEAKALRILVYNGKFYLDYGSGVGGNRISGGTAEFGGTYEVEVGNRYIKDLTTGEMIISADPVADFSYDNILETGSCVLYYLKIYENDELVRDFVPIQTVNGKATLFERLEQKIYEPNGIWYNGYSAGY